MAKKFNCRICKRRFNSAEEAEDCSQKPITVAKFSKGEIVKNISAASCGCFFREPVRKVIGPMLQGNSSHGYRYEIKFRCYPYETMRGVFREWELIKCPEAN